MRRTTPKTITSKRTLCIAFATLCLNLSFTQAAQKFNRLAVLPDVKITNASPEFPGGHYNANNLLDGNRSTEYSSNSKGTDTFIEFDFQKPVTIAGFRHVDRNDPATIKESKLTFLNNDGQAITTATVIHPDQAGGVATHVLQNPVTARKARWKITKLGKKGFPTVGGSEIKFFTLGKSEPAAQGTTLTAKAIPVLERKKEKHCQPIRLTIDYPYAQTLDAFVYIDDAKITPVHLSFGEQTLTHLLPAAQSSKNIRITLRAANQTLAKQNLTLKPINQTVIYILPHSHVDIGYTETQPEVEKKQMAHIDKGIEIARATADYPEDSRYTWNVEVLWAVQSYLEKSSPQKQKAFIEAVKKGWIGLDAMYCNELTGLCRPEELLRLFSYSKKLADRCDVTIDSAMISDVPGYTWGTVSAMAQAGIKYWSIGTNFCARIGYTLSEWENKPFYWRSPSGEHKVLCWVPYKGYALSHLHQSTMSEQVIFDFMTHLQKTDYPYDITHIRWSGTADNAAPDEKLPTFVKEWNARYASPRLVIATTAEAFRAFEKRYADRIPTYSGDWTPYWEDGAASSARETAIARTASECLVQAEILWSLLNPSAYPSTEFRQAWRNVLLYNEHTWGAYNSVTDPEKQFVKDQWKHKQVFALDAQSQSKKLLAKATQNTKHTDQQNDIDVFNTCSWKRTDLVEIPAELSTAGDRVLDADNQPVPSQRLSTGQLAFLAEDVPPFANRRYTITAGQPFHKQKVLVQKETLKNDTLSIHLDEQTGAIVELRATGIDKNFADTQSIALNDYFYVVDDNNDRFPVGRSASPWLS